MLVQPLIILMIIFGGLLILRQLKNQQRAQAMSRAENEGIVKLKQTGQTFPKNKGTHIPLALLKDWTEDKLNGGVHNPNLTRGWKYHLAHCLECREMFEFCREEYITKIRKESLNELKN